MKDWKSSWKRFFKIFILHLHLFLSFLWKVKFCILQWLFDFLDGSVSVVFSNYSQGGSHVFETGRAPAFSGTFRNKNCPCQIGLYTYLVQKLPVPRHGGHIRWLHPWDVPSWISVLEGKFSEINKRPAFNKHPGGKFSKTQ